VVAVQTLPSAGSDIVGGTITFSAVFGGGGYADIPNASSSTLTIANLQLSDSGSYNLVATHGAYSVTSAPSVFTVNDVPAAMNGIIIASAKQLGLGLTTTFSPSWAVSTNSLIAGRAPSSVGPGNFDISGTGATVAVLTDGQYGTLGIPTSASSNFVECGTVAGGAGHWVIYTLTGSAYGYDLTNLVVYGGWSDGGRDQQLYNIYYSTVASPTNFNNQLAFVTYNPANRSGLQSATRATVFPATSQPLAKSGGD
jgi:hypothetical protein